MQAGVLSSTVIASFISELYIWPFTDILLYIIATKLAQSM